MSEMVRFEIENLKELTDKLKQIGEDVARRGLLTSLTAGALIVQNAAKENAPWRTGTLRRSIHTETVSSSSESAAVAVGTDVVYAAIQEFGGIVTPKVANALVFQVPPKSGHWVNVQMVEIPAHPYLRPALDENLDRIENEIVGALNEIIEAAL